MSLENLFPPWEIHPATIHFPIALLVSGVALDLYAWWRGRDALAAIAFGALVAGVLTGVVAAVTGLLAFYTLPHTHTEQAHTLMYWHLGFQVAALLLFMAVVLLRWKSGKPSGTLHITALIATAVLLIGSYLGGFLVYHGAAGIDPNLLSPSLHEGHHHGADESHLSHPD